GGDALMPRRRYRRPRFRTFRPGLAAKAPGLMLLVGLLVSLSVHAGLGFTLQDHAFGRVDPDAFAREVRPVRVKRATFDQIVRPADEGLGGLPTESADTLAERLLDEVAPSPSDVFDPELELRQAPEPLPRPEAEAPATAEALDFESMLEGLIDAPEELAFAESEAFDAERSAGPGSAALAGDLLSELTSDAGGLPAVGRVGEGKGPGGGSAGGAGGGADAGFGPGVGGSGVAVAGGRGVTSSGGGGGIDFLDFGGLNPADFEPPQRLDEDFDYTITRYRDDDRANPNVTGGGYFRVNLAGRRSLRKLETMPKDVVFMVDTSRSIPQRTINQITDAIRQSVRTMNDGDRFNLVFFSDQVRTFAGEPVPPTRENLATADRWLRNARARGQTDVNLALRRLLRRDLDPGRVYELILISDGRPTLGVLDTRELINLITRENDLAASIYCVGIGRQQDNRLLDFLAYRNKGFSVSIDRRADVTLELLELMSRLRYPIITDVQVRFAGQGMDEVYPLTLPNIHQGERFDVFGRYRDLGPFTIQVTGRSAGRPVDLTFRYDLTDAAVGDRELARGWAFWKLHHLYSEIIRLGERPELLDAIRRLRTRYELETLY
ncbi:MAG: VWA domain-containing protein, partial [Planctomycetota bacterium]